MFSSPSLLRQPTAEEERAVAELLSLNRNSIDVAARPARRGQHPKHHGCVSIHFRVKQDIPPHLQVGMFAAAHDFKGYVRFSNGRAWDDRRADAHGMAIKLLDVPGGPQDFVLVDHETFFTGSPLEYGLVNRVLLADRVIDRVRAGICLLLRPKLLARILAFISKRPSSPLIPYFSTVPYRLGETAVKYVAVPRNMAPRPAPSGADGFSEALRDVLSQTKVVFDFGIDLQVDADSQPIDDPTISWSKAGASRIWLAEIEIPAQDFGANAALAEQLAFSPWNALPAHEPLGFINRARRPIYRELADLRHRLNGLSDADGGEGRQA